MIRRYTLLLILFEYRAATLLIQNQFPGSTAASITKIELDNDVISLDGRDPLRTESEVESNGRIRVRIRRSISSNPDSSTSIPISTPRPSNLSNAEIFSVNTFGYRSGSPRLSGYASSDAYSLQPTPRASNFNELEESNTNNTNTPVSVWSRSPVPGTGRLFRHPSPVFAGVRMLWDSPQPSKFSQSHQEEKRERSKVHVMIAGEGTFTSSVKNCTCYFPPCLVVFYYFFFFVICDKRLSYYIWCRNIKQTCNLVQVGLYVLSQKGHEASLSELIDLTD